jgi:transcriptional regulator with XRE-family HTH domain
MTGIKQQAISRLENPYYGKATLTTLKRIAAAFDVGLLVEFVPFSQLVNRVSGTPYIEYGFTPETMNVPSFEEEEKRGAFTETTPAALSTPGSLHVVWDASQVRMLNMVQPDPPQREEKLLFKSGKYQIFDIGVPRTELGA